MFCISTFFGNHMQRSRAFLKDYLLFCCCLFTEYCRPGINWPKYSLRVKPPSE